MLKIDLSYKTGFLLCLTLIFLWGCDQPPETQPETPPDPQPEIQIKQPPVKLSQTEFNKLDGWMQDDLQGSLEAFLNSCIYFDKRGVDSALTGIDLSIRSVDMKPVCINARAINGADSAAIRGFFEQHFTPYKIWKLDKKSSQEKLESGYSKRGLFTGYYESRLHVSTQQSPLYPHPIWGAPTDMLRINLADFDPSLAGKTIHGRVDGDQFLPYYNRQQIDQLAQTRLAKGEQPILWAKDSLDLFILHIQGSGIGELPDGSELRIGYAANNGHRYRSIGRYLIDQGELSRHQAGWNQIRDWIINNPDQADRLLQVNPRYIFFQINDGNEGPFGSIGQPLVPQRSLAVDPEFMPLGLPIWLDGTHPNPNEAHLRRLMIAQDTGNAIKGIIRGDFFWGSGNHAQREAGRMKSTGSYYLLLPQFITPPPALTLTQPREW